MKQEISIESLQPLVVQNLQEHGYLHPVLFICGSDEEACMVTPEGQDTLLRESYINVIIELVKKKEAYKIIFVSEGTMWREGEEGKQEKIYQIVELTKTETNAVVQPFKEKKGKIVFTKKPIHTTEGEHILLKSVQNALIVLQ